MMVEGVMLFCILGGLVPFISGFLVSPVPTMSFFVHGFGVMSKTGTKMWILIEHVITAVRVGWH